MKYLKNINIKKKKKDMKMGLFIYLSMRFIEFGILPYP